MKDTTPPAQTDSTPTCGPYYPAKNAEERLKALRGIRGMWKGRDPDPVEYFENLRHKSDRELPERQS